jgi:hypothetical protein
VFGVSGAEAARLDSTGLTLATGLKLPVGSAGLSWTGAYTNTGLIRWQITGNQCTLTSCQIMVLQTT